MALYMAQFTYTPEAWAHLAKQPEDRSLGLKTILEHVGGRLLHLYYAFGEYDGVVIFEAPDDVAAAVTPLAANVAGHLKAIKTTKLFSVEDAMTIMQRVGAVTYKAPTGWASGRSVRQPITWRKGTLPRSCSGVAARRSSPTMSNRYPLVALTRADKSESARGLT